MSKYRKKPIIIEAVQCSELLNQAGSDWYAMPEWIRLAYDAGRVIFGRQEIHIKTLEGDLVAGNQDWIIRGIQGELYPCKPDIFEATYEKMEEAPHDPNR